MTPVYSSPEVQRSLDLISHTHLDRHDGRIELSESQAESVANTRFPPFRKPLFDEDCGEIAYTPAKDSEDR